MGPYKEMGGHDLKSPELPKHLKKNHLFLAVLVLHCRTQVFSSHGKWGYSLLWTHRLLIVGASPVVDHGSGARASGGAAQGLSCQRILGKSTAVRGKGESRNSEAAGDLPDKEVRRT